MTPNVQSPTSATVLDALTLERLLDLNKTFGLGLHSAGQSKAKVTQALAQELQSRLQLVLEELGRDELRTACKRHGLAAESRSRQELQDRLLKAAGIERSQDATPLEHHQENLPRPGQVIEARHRQWMVEAVHAGNEHDSARLELVCLDDDAPGQTVDMLWDLELGAKVIDPATQGLDPRGRLDPPEHFGAYLHALKWSAVSAADATANATYARGACQLWLAPSIRCVSTGSCRTFSLGVFSHCRCGFE